MLSTEVIVVGGGPGGCAAALGLARRGHEVVLLDRATFPRHKVCGEGLMPVGVAELEALGLDRVVSGWRFHGIRYAVPGATASGRFPGARHGLGLRRDALDHALNDAVRSAGVDVRHGCRVQRVERGSRRQVVHTDDGPLSGRVVVAADGMRSPIRQQLGLQRSPRGRPRYGARGHFRLAEGAPQLDVVAVYVLPGLELYLTPVGPRALNVAVLLERDATRPLKGNLQDGFLELVRGVPELQPILDGAVVDGPVGLTGPLRQEATAVVGDGVALVGDAAGFLDGITGEGMSLTLASARLASEVLSGALRKGDVSAAALAPYARRRAAFARELTLLTEIVLGGIRHRRLAHRVVRGLARHPDVFERVLGVSTGGRVLDVGLVGLAKVLVA